MSALVLLMGLGGACRTARPLVSQPSPLAPAVESVVAAPILRIGIVTDAPRASLGTDTGLRVWAYGPAGEALPGRTLPRATFLSRGPTPGAQAGAVLRLLETGEDVSRALLLPLVTAEPIAVEATAYRGVMEVRPGEGASVTVVNIVNLEDYLRGVIPNELSPQAYPQIEALKAQAVAARTYALRNRGQYAAKGYDICATAACQVYRGLSSEQPLSDRAVEGTRGLTAAYHGTLINALYTSTCGGHTEDAANIFEGETAPYLKGVACVPEQSAWTVLHGATPPVAASKEEGLDRSAALLVALGVLEPEMEAAAALKSPASGAELQAWTARLVVALHRRGCAAAPPAALSRRGTFMGYLVSSLCWQERAERMLAPGDPEYLLQVADRGELGGEQEKTAAALLVQEGVVSPFPDNTLRVGAVLTRGDAVRLLARAAERAGAPALVEGEFRAVSDDSLTVAAGDATETYPMDPKMRLFRALDGQFAETRQLSVAAGERVRLVLSGGRIAFLEADQPRLGAAADRSSRYYRWEVRLTPGEVAKAIGRYGTVGAVRDLVARRVGVSGRVVELSVSGSEGDLVLRGLRVRWGLGLRENLFVIDRERAADGAVERFVFTGKGWGHGVGLCQVGAFGMAQSGSTYDQILRHYYSGVSIAVN